MRNDERAYLLFSDHLGSSSVVMDANGELVEKAYYLPWGGARGEEGITSTDYGYTGQMKEGDIYYYGASYYDPSIGRFMQADTIVPLQVQGTQAFDRYAYVNNNPLRYTDPSGHYYQECGDDNYGRCGTISAPTPKKPWYERNGVYVFRGSGYFGKPMLGPISPSQDASMLDPNVSGISPLHIGGNVLEIVNSQLGMYIPTVMPVDKDNVFWELVFRVFDEKIYVKSFNIESKISEIYVKYISVILKFTYTETQNQINSGDVEMELMHDVFLYEHPHGYKKEFNDYVKFPVDALSIDLNIRMYCKFCSTNNGPLFDTIHQRLK